ncbi:30S ribosomal protein S16 [Candidatus Sneabacter namystus]|uniref:Small ribosomal subunit protein bS16 n=1 Tax=Candidatus Sneabacter namystus TaxID=2601646 RepID=A0A5C0UHJ8_9RICK|nr:30S ribosomal protein S16 [Candidatus Sneabacter namystus]QEK39608.1 30S ribosomal protein S16 [Candidatus Sneabacter namystus]
MAVKVRLLRGGRKGSPCYSIVAAASSSPRDGKFFEKLGVYHPMLKSENEKRFVVDEARVLHWFSCGAQPTDRVIKLLLNAKFALPEKIQKKWNLKMTKKTNKPKKKEKTA